jgi:hypothetical protein
MIDLGRGDDTMTRIEITSAKISIIFPEDRLPAIDPAHPSFVIALGGHAIQAGVNVKAARKLATHEGGAVLEGKLVAQGDKLVLIEAGFTWLEPRAVQAQAITQALPGAELV